MAEKETAFIPLFPSPLMQVQLDLDLEKLTELAFQIQNKDKEGINLTNKGGWHSDLFHEGKYEEIIKHEEFIKLEKEIDHYLQIYHSRIYKGILFKESVIQKVDNMWVNINEKHHYNEWHIHHRSNLSGAFYIKHDGSVENGTIIFKNPIHHFPYIMQSHWPLFINQQSHHNELVEKWNENTSELIDFIPKPNMLLIFPSWLEHKAETNLKDDTRISLSFNSLPILEKKSQ